MKFIGTSISSRREGSSEVLDISKDTLMKKDWSRRMSKKTTIVKFRRKREGKTNYKKRLAILKSHGKRLVIRLSLDNISAQIIEYQEDGDKVIVSGHSRELVKLGWNMKRNNLPASYLVGLIIGKKAQAKKISEVIPDLGFQGSTKGSKIYALIKGITDAGIKVNVKEEMLPPEERINGKHISEYAKKLKETEEIYKKRFSGYLKNNIDPESLPSIFEEIKKKI